MLTIETLRNNAAKFANDFSAAHYEMGQGQSFIIGLCKVFELDYLRAVRFEDRVKKAKGKGRIDAFFPSLLLVEMKSAGKNLDDAYNQATDYFDGLKTEDLPRCVLVSDFQNLHLYNQETKEEPLKIKLSELPQHIERFRFLTGYQKIVTERLERISKEAADKMAVLHDAIKATDYTGKDLETYLVRLLFCLFADNTGLFGENGTFLHYLKTWTDTDGSDLHGALNKLFDTLNTPDEKYLAEHTDYKGKKRLNNLPEHLADFPYINGALFEGGLAECYFDESSRAILIECANLDWSEISPAIFGSLFQAIMHFDDEAANAKTKKRREFGAHYTSEANILKVINPLFMDDLRAEFNTIPKTHQRKLVTFHQKLAKLNFFDPACGCGNFLIIAYRELRLLELEVIKRQCGAKPTDKEIQSLILCDVDQFHGIDIDESAVHIALVAMWLTDHQVNLKVQVLGNYYNRIPLVKKANIVCANALRIDWTTVIKPKECSFIMGNPPFVGAKMMNDAQRADIAPIFGKLKNGGLLDYVAAWHVKATEYIKKNPKIPVAFVSTNSICQGEQVTVLWSWLLEQGVKIRFAHRTFRWSNEGRGVAAVHCVIVGFGLQEPSSYRLFACGENIKGEEIKATQINPYLVNAPNVLIERRNKPLCDVPEIGIGNKPIDDGNYLFTTEEKAEFIAKEPASEPFFKRWLGAHEFINGYERWCLWLGDIEPNKLTKMPLSMERVAAVKKFRASSKSKPTRKIAATPRRFHVEFMPTSDYLVIPEVSSQTRDYLPLGFLSPDTLSSNKLRIFPNATKYFFGVLQSQMHMAWMRSVCGRMKSDYQYSVSIVYNNFPWATPDAKQIKAIEEKAQAVLNARAVHTTSTLADLYNPLTMPPNLTKAHAALDKAVDAAYGYKEGKDDTARVAFLFEQYQKLTAPLIETETAKKPKKIKP